MGSDLEAFLPLHKLNVANRQLEQLDFVPGGTSFIGLTLTGDQINLSPWRFLSTPFLSDHPYIYFEVELANFEPKPSQTLQRRVSSPPLIQVDLFRTNLANIMRIKPSEPHLDWNDAIEGLIANLTNGITNSAHASYFTSHASSKLKKLKNHALVG